MDEYLLGGDLPVRRIGFGAMRLTGPDLFGDVRDRAAAIALLREVADGGPTLVDTADVYGPHTNEQLVHDALHPYGRTVVATKGGFIRGGPDLATIEAIGRPNYLRQAAYLSARRLGVERIDLYYLHSAAATDASFAEQVGVLADLRREGLIRHIGLSNIGVEHLRTATAITQVAAVTAHYNVADRTGEALLRATLDAGAAFVPWQPVSLIAPGVATDVSGSEQVGRVLAEIAAEHEVTVPQVALAWLLAIDPAVLPIPSTTSLGHWEEDLGALELVLAPGELGRIGALA